MDHESFLLGLFYGLGIGWLGCVCTVVLLSRIARRKEKDTTP